MPHRHRGDAHRATPQVGPWPGRGSFHRRRQGKV